MIGGADMRPIDADDLGEKIEEVWCKDCTAAPHRLACVTCVITGIMTSISASKTLDVAPVVHARWIWNAHKGFYECSRCAGARYHDLMLGLNAQYCGYCGAKMDGEERD